MAPALPDMAFPETPEDHIEFWEDFFLEELVDYCYVMQGDPGTPIKIGHALDPVGRLATFQTGNPQELRLLHVTPGGEGLEREFHRRLKSSRIRGEWFGGAGVGGFLTWIPEYVDGVVAHAEEYGELPELPLPRKADPYSGEERSGANVAHRWRMSQPRETTLAVRWVEPEPTPPDERQRREEIRAFGYARTSNGSNPTPDTQGTEARPSAG